MFNHNNTNSQGLVHYQSPYQPLRHHRDEYISEIMNKYDLKIYALSKEVKDLKKQLQNKLKVAEYTQNKRFMLLVKTIDNLSKPNNASMNLENTFQHKKSGFRAKKIQNNTKIFTKKKKCDNCIQNSIYKYCDHCELFLCTNCITQIHDEDHVNHHYTKIQGVDYYYEEENHLKKIEEKIEEKKKKNEMKLKQQDEEDDLKNTEVLESKMLSHISPLKITINKKKNTKEERTQVLEKKKKNFLEVLENTEGKIKLNQQQNLQQEKLSKIPTPEILLNNQPNKLRLYKIKKKTKKVVTEKKKKLKIWEKPLLKPKQPDSELQNNNKKKGIKLRRKIKQPPKDFIKLRRLKSEKANSQFKVKKVSVFVKKNKEKEDFNEMLLKAKKDVVQLKKVTSEDSREEESSSSSTEKTSTEEQQESVKIDANKMKLIKKKKKNINIKTTTLNFGESKPSVEEPVEEPIEEPETEVKNTEESTKIEKEQVIEEKVIEEENEKEDLVIEELHTDLVIEEPEKVIEEEEKEEEEEEEEEEKEEIFFQKKKKTTTSINRKNGSAMLFNANDDILELKALEQFNQDIVAVSMGVIHGGIITKSNLVYMWGSNRDHQLGIPDANEDVIPEEARLVTLPNNAGKPVLLSCGTYHNMLLDSNGKVYSWGQGLMGVLGHGSDRDEEFPREIETFFKKEDNQEECESSAIFVSAGAYNSCIITEDYKVYIWGANEQGQVGNHTYIPQLLPQLILFKTCITQVQFGQKHTIALDTEGDVYTWGDNNFGQLGYILEDIEDSNTTRCNQPKKITTLPSKVKVIKSGENHNTVLTIDGKLYSWGLGESHQIGVFDNIDQYVPIYVKDLDGIHIQHIEVGISISAAIDTQGNTYLWGYSIGTPIPKLQKNFQSSYCIDIALGDADNCMLFTIPSQEIYCWNTREEDANEDLDVSNEEDDADSLEKKKKNQLKKIDLLRGKRIKQISLGYEHYLALDQSGQVLSWGNNSYGQLGLSADNNSVIDYLPSPMSVLLDYTQIKIKEITCGPKHNILLDTNGFVYTFGEGLYGKLGHNTDLDLSKPTKVENVKNITKIYANYDNTAVIDKNGFLYLCGSGQYGQLGRKDKVLLPSMTFQKFKNKYIGVIEHLSIGQHHMSCITDEYECFIWGNNQFGQCGIHNSDEQIDDILLPTQIHLLTKNAVDDEISQVECSATNTLFLTKNKKQLYSCGAVDTLQLGYHSEYDVYIPQHIDVLKDQKITKIILGPYDVIALDENKKDIFTWGFSFQEIPTKIQLMNDEDIEQDKKIIGIDIANVLMYIKQ